MAEVDGYKVEFRASSQKSGTGYKAESASKTQKQEKIAVKENIVGQSQIDYQNGLNTLDVWIGGGTLNIGATTKDVVHLTKARDELNSFLYYGRKRVFPWTISIG